MAASFCSRPEEEGLPLLISGKASSPSSLLLFFACIAPEGRLLVVCEH